MDVSGVRIVERIDTLLKDKNLKRQAVADYAGFNVANIAHWKNRDNVPAADTAIKIAQFLNVSVEWLITGTDPAGLTAPERDLLSQYRSLSAADQEEIQALLQLKYNRTKQSKNEVV